MFETSVYPCCPQGKAEHEIGKKEVAKGEVVEGKEKIKEGEQEGPQLSPAVKQGKIQGNGALFAKGEVFLDMVTIRNSSMPRCLSV